MKKIDLHDEFVKALLSKVSRKTDLADKVSDILRIEKEPASRRLTGKVNFSVREIGILANEFNISLDELLHRVPGYLWLPFILESPLKFRSIDILYETIDCHLNRLCDMTREPTESGTIFNILPMEFYMNLPVLMKFMFFKWGHCFVRSEEFNNFSQWQIAPRMTTLHDRVEKAFSFDKLLYIWDNSLIWTLVREVDNFHNMHIINTEDKNKLKEEINDLLTRLEQVLNGTCEPFLRSASEMDFYVSTINAGFTCNYFASPSKHFVTFSTNFSFSEIESTRENFTHIKEWIKSIRNVSTLLSQSGRMERRLFFENQHNIVNKLL
ncbi:MAG: hypothetical protein LUH22_07735 [Bacteroides sp.]|nr:hypothetical protein [Bacteroides sp.]